MPGNSFVQEERFHRPLATRFDVVSIRIKNSGARAVGRAGLVRPARRGCLAERLDTTNLETCFWHDVEQLLRQLRNVLGHIPVALDQLFGLVIEELIIGIHKLKKLLQRAIETDLIHHALHFLVNPSHLVQADLVNLVG